MLWEIPLNILFSFTESAPKVKPGVQPERNTSGFFFLLWSLMQFDCGLSAAWKLFAQILYIHNVVPCNSITALRGLVERVVEDLQLCILPLKWEVEIPLWVYTFYKYLD